MAISGRVRTLGVFASFLVFYLFAIREGNLIIIL